MYDDMINLFERYGFTVEEVGPKSYVARNNNIGFAIAFTPSIFHNRCEAMAATYLTDDIDAVIDEYKRCGYPEFMTIGGMAYNPRRGSIMDTARYDGGLYNHDLNTWEIERWLISVTKGDV